MQSKVSALESSSGEGEDDQSTEENLEGSGRGQIWNSVPVFA